MVKYWKEIYFPDLVILVGAVSVVALSENNNKYVSNLHAYPNNMNL